jgi:glutathione peroxidase
VVKGEAQNSIFRWLTSKEKNGWNEQQPTWNFSKYLVNENGILTHYFEPSVSPLDPEVIEAIER